MEGGSARQVGALDEEDVLPAESRQPVEDRGAADASSDHNRTSPVSHARATLTSCASLPPRRPSRSCESAAADSSSGRRGHGAAAPSRRGDSSAPPSPRSDRDISPRAGGRLRALRSRNTWTASPRSSRSSCAASRAATSRGTGTGWPGSCGERWTSRPSRGRSRDEMTRFVPFRSCSCSAPIWRPAPGGRAPGRGHRRSAGPASPPQLRGDRATSRSRRPGHRRRRGLAGRRPGSALAPSRRELHHPGGRLRRLARRASLPTAARSSSSTRAWPSRAAPPPWPCSTRSDSEPADLITLQGDFSFDALSPDGRLLYLVQYLSPRDPTRYLVRLYDLERGSAAPEADHRPAGGRRRHARHARHADLEPRRPLRLHALRRRSASTRSSTPSTPSGGPRAASTCTASPATRALRAPARRLPGRRDALGHAPRRLARCSCRHEDGQVTEPAAPEAAASAAAPSSRRRRRTGCPAGRRHPPRPPTPLRPPAPPETPPPPPFAASGRSAGWPSRRSRRRGRRRPAGRRPTWPRGSRT